MSTKTLPVSNAARNSLERFYFSPENFNVFMKLCQDYMHQEKLTALKRTEPVKNILLRALNSAKRKKVNLNNIVDMNRLALQEAIPLLLHEVEKRPEVHKSLFTAASFDADDSFLNKPLSTTDEPTFTEKNLKTMVDEQYPYLDNLVKMSSLSNEEKIGVSSAGSGSAGDSGELVFFTDNEDIIQKFQNMQRLKSQNNATTTSTVSAFAPIDEDSSSDEEETIEKTFVMKEDVFSYGTTQQNEVIASNETAANPDVEENNVQIFLNSQNEDFVSSNVGINYRGPLVTKDSFEYVQHFLAVSSADRNFRVDEKFNRYNFSVTFNSQQLVTKRFPVYENNPLIQLPSKRLESNPQYDPNQPLGEIVGYYDVRTGMTEGLNIPARISNVAELRIESVCLYFSDLDSHFSRQCFDSGQTMLHYPYLILQIEELTSIYKSTNEFFHKNVIKIMNDKTWEQGVSGRSGYHLFRPMGAEMFTFPVPVALLNRLTIRILTPSGSPLKSIRETSLLQTITIVNPGNGDDYYLKLVTKEYQPTCLLPSDHVVRFQDFDWYNPVSGICSGSPWQEFKDWLQGIDGHVLVENPEDPPSRDDPVPVIAQVFYVKFPSVINWATGTVKPVSFAKLSPENLNILFHSTQNRLINGSMYNTTIQTHISMNAVCKTRREGGTSDTI